MPPKWRVVHETVLRAAREFAECLTSVPGGYHGDVVDHPHRRVRFEFRVWGSHGPAHRLLAELAEGQTLEQTEDCYLLVDDPSWNVKVRNGTLKIKRLVAELDGFEQWASDRHRCGATAPSPFGTILDSLGQFRELSATTDPLADTYTSDAGRRPVFVTKKRRRFRLGELRAETTGITVRESGKVLYTLSIEGADLDRLRDLRERLGLCADDNLAVHRALCAHR
jgi:hypothetical protein